MTRYEKIKAMSIEEMAKFLLKMMCKYSNIIRKEINKLWGTNIQLVDAEDFANDNYGAWVKMLESEVEENG